MLKHPLFVVPIDSSREMNATVGVAVALARQCEGRIHLVEVAPRRGPSLLKGRPDDWLEGVRVTEGDWSRFEDLIETAARSHVRVRTVTYRGAPGKIISSYVQLTKATLLILNKHYGTSRWRRSAGTVTGLSRSVGIPVLVVPPQLGSQTSTSLSFRRVVSPIDFTVASAVAVRTVVDLTRRTGARLTLVHALKDGPQHLVFSGGEALRVARNLRAQAAQIAERLRRKIPSDVRVRVDARVTTGVPHRRILEIASEVNADLIVMGVPPRRRLDEMLFGSTLRHVVRRAKIPVLVLPVPAGAYEWLGETGGVAGVIQTTNSERATRVRPRL